MIDIPMSYPFLIDSELFLDRYEQLSLCSPKESYYDASWAISSLCDLLISYECLLKGLYYTYIDKNLIKTHDLTKLSDLLINCEYFSPDEVEEIDDDNEFIWTGDKLIDQIMEINKFLPKFPKGIYFTDLRYSYEHKREKGLYRSYTDIIYDIDLPPEGNIQYNKQLYTKLKNLHRLTRDLLFG